jgi:hypothetical protein
MMMVHYLLYSLDIIRLWIFFLKCTITETWFALDNKSYAYYYIYLE